MTVDVPPLTLEEKANLTAGEDAWHTVAVPRLGIKPVEVSDGPHGLRRETGVHQVWYPATCFPTASCIAASWDVELVQRMGNALGREVRAAGVGALLGPGANMKRDPLCGRNFEYFSEDPALAGHLAAAYIIGVQSTGVGACLKHFAANNQEVDRFFCSSEVDERTLREIYLPAFEIAVRSRPWLVMASYNLVNGTYSCANPWLLTQVLREEWGYDGLVVSDWDAVHDPYTPLDALLAGCDVRMPAEGDRKRDITTDLAKAGAQDPLAVAALDRVARLVADLASKLPPVGEPSGATSHADGLQAQAAQAGDAATAGSFDETFLSPAQLAEHHDLAREGALASMVLLRNEPRAADLATRVLPLGPGIGRVAIIGHYAKAPRIQGGGSSRVNPTRVDEPLTEIANAAPAGVDILFAEGYPVALSDGPRAHDGERSYDDDLVADDALIAEAVDLAQSAEAAVVFVGTPATWETEGDDRGSFALPPAQQELVAAVTAARPETIVVVMAGSPCDLNPWNDHTGAVLLAGYAGQGSGWALAQLLWGHAAPSGKLAETWPTSYTDTPAYPSFPARDKKALYAEGPFIGYRWYDKQGIQPLYPFGHGLVYNPLTLDNLRTDGSGTVTVDVHNTTGSASSDVVQVYIARRPSGDSSIDSRHAVRQLRGFERIHLPAGASRSCTFTLTERDLDWYDVDTDAWQRIPGRLVVEVGFSSRDIRLTAPLSYP